MIDLEQAAAGVILPVKAQAGGRTNALRGEQNGMLKVSVTQVAERGKANQAILRLLAEKLELRRNQIELMAGETSSQKKFLIRDCELEELRRRLTVLVPAG